MYGRDCGFEEDYNNPVCWSKEYGIGPRVQTPEELASVKRRAEALMAYFQSAWEKSLTRDPGEPAREIILS